MQHASSSAPIRGLLCATVTAAFRFSGHRLQPRRRLDIEKHRGDLAPAILVLILVSESIRPWGGRAEQGLRGGRAEQGLDLQRVSSRTAAHPIAQAHWPFRRPTVVERDGTLPEEHHDGRAKEEVAHFLALPSAIS